MSNKSKNVESNLGSFMEDEMKRESSPIVTPDNPGETAALESAVETDEETTFKGKRFIPNQATADIIDRTTKATGLSVTDLVNVSLILLQDATPAEIKRAIDAIQGDIADRLLKALK